MNIQDPAILRKQTKHLAVLAGATSICSFLLLLFSLLDLGSVSLYCLPPSAAFSAIYYSVAFLKSRGPHPSRLLTSGFALTLPWILLVVDCVGISFVCVMLSWTGLDRLHPGVFTDNWTVAGVGNAGTVVTQLVLAVMHTALLMAIFGRGVIARRCAKAPVHEYMQPMKA